MEATDPQMSATQPETPVAKRHMSGARRLIVTALLSVGMMAVGGVVVVNAASPAPAASAPAAGGSGTHTAPANSANCPNM